MSHDVIDSAVVKKRWDSVLYVDEVMFSTKADTTGRLVRRPRGASRTDPKYTRKTWKRPAKQMALCGFTSTGTRFVHFLPPGESMNSKRYTDFLSKQALMHMRTNDLTLLHDRSRVHTSKHSQNFLKENGVKSLLLLNDSHECQRGTKQKAKAMGAMVTL